VFELQATPEGYSIFRFIIIRNLAVVKRARAVVQDQQRKWWNEAARLISLPRNSESMAWIPSYEAILAEKGEPIQHWMECIEAEVELSSIALQRLEIAGQVAQLIKKNNASKDPDPQRGVDMLFKAYCKLREQMVGLVVKINDLTNNNGFLERHDKELWDVVELSLN
jgi:hypothetical protein